MFKKAIAPAVSETVNPEPPQTFYSVVRVKGHAYRLMSCVIESGKAPVIGPVGKDDIQALVISRMNGLVSKR